MSGGVVDRNKKQRERDVNYSVQPGSVIHDFRDTKTIRPLRQFRPFGRSICEILTKRLTLHKMKKITVYIYPIFKGKECYMEEVFVA